LSKIDLEKRWKYCNEKYSFRDTVTTSLFNEAKIKISSIYDLGCGKQSLREYFEQKNIKYIPVDKYSRSKDTIVVDFNKKEFPKKKVDCCLLLGVFEYIKGLQSFIDLIEKKTQKIIICSFCFLANKKTREATGWINHIYDEEVFLRKFKKFKAYKKVRVKNWVVFLMEKEVCNK